MIDEKYVQRAIEIILEYKKVSTTLLVRKMNTSFAMASMIMDALENKWIIWPQVWAKPREIYFDNIEVEWKNE